jgi:hypothetical protein
MILGNKPDNMSWEQWREIEASNIAYENPGDAFKPRPTPAAIADDSPVCRGRQCWGCPTRDCKHAIPSCPPSFSINTNDPV